MEGFNVRKKSVKIYSIFDNLIEVAQNHARSLNKLGCIF